MDIITACCSLARLCIYAGNINGQFEFVMLDIYEQFIVWHGMAFRIVILYLASARPRVSVSGISCALEKRAKTKQRMHNKLSKGREKNIKKFPAKQQAAAMNSQQRG
jgi:hypothetical protein